MTRSRAEKSLRWLLTLMGATAVLAFVAVVMPTDWMESANDFLGLGPFPQAPLTQYLTRSLSALYGCLGLLIIYLGFNVRRYLDLIIVVAWLIMLLGVLLTGIDFKSGMPASWAWGEGPPTVVLGAAFLWLARKAG